MSESEEAVKDLLESLIREGTISDGDKARRRLQLGCPAWLILEDLGLEGAAAVLSQATDISLLEHGIENHDASQRRTISLHRWLGRRLTSHNWFTEILLPTTLAFFSKKRPGFASTAVDVEDANNYGPVKLKARRWVPLVDGRVAIADPFGSLPDGELAGRKLCIAPAREIDRALSVAFPKECESRGKGARRLGRLLLDAGQITEKDLAEALDEQARSGGRLDEILLAYGMVDPAAIMRARASKLGYPLVQAGEKPVPLLPAHQARAWRAVALSTGSEEPDKRQTSPPVAFSDPSAAAVKAVEDHLKAPIQPRLTDAATLDQLLAEAYVDVDVEEVTTSLLKHRPHLSAYRTLFSRAQFITGIALLTALVIGFAANMLLPFVVMVGIASTFYILYMMFRTYISWIGWRDESTINPSMEDLQALEDRELPAYTILLPVYKEKVSTLSELFKHLSKLDYPAQKLNGMLLVEADDRQTQEVTEAIGGSPGWLKVVDVPPEVYHTSPESWYFGEDAKKDHNKLGWLRTLLIPPGGPRTKPKAMVYGLLYARGKLLTVYDAEDQPDPYQLKKAAWAFKSLDDSVACLQAKLNYYNPRQNLLTRWFTMEYSVWFDTFLPGLHVMKAPIPLGGTSNHFRVDALRDVLSWDPYNVTEDADLGLRFARTGKRTLALESTTYEEANSDLKNWIRQRSRWIKGYMQTFLVHTRHPKVLYRELGLRSSLVFLAIVGGLIFTALVSPIFWAILLLWILAQPDWMPALFPGPVYYMALASLLIGNFLFIFHAVIGAVGRGYDDLTLYALLIPIYWVLISVAGYVALFELIVKPHYWQKTEHGLHLHHLQKRDSQSRLLSNVESSLRSREG